MADFTEEQALKMEKPADKFLIKLEDNIYGVRFNGFKLRDIQTDKVYHEYYPADPYELDYFADHMLDYPFPNDILKGQKHLGTSLKIVVGDKLVKNLVLLERHYKVRLGISYKELLEKCGGFKNEPKLMISGGPMMGIPLYNLDIPVSKSSSAFLAFNNDPKDKDKETHCIRCGKCVDVCPVLLTPNKMLIAARRNDFETYLKLNGQECISCGCCSYICPAKKPLTPYFQYMKANMRKYLDSRKEVK